MKVIFSSAKRMKLLIENQLKKYKNPNLLKCYNKAF